MPTRLVLGLRPDTRVLAERLAEAGDVLAVVDDEREAEWLAEQSVPVERGDPADPDLLAELADGVGSVVVATTDDERTDRVVAAAREVLPEATVLAYGSPADGALARPGADRSLDPTSVVAARVLDHVASQAGERALSLRATLRSLDGPLAVLTHDNPDPDAIASAVALAHLAEAVGVEAQPCYFGDIAHHENRALVNLLDLDLRQLDHPDELAAFGSLALVDHARPGVNDSLPASTAVDVVIDHHPTDGPDEVEFLDLRSGVGSTSTLLTEYYDRLGLELPETVATALLYGLRVDTDDFTRETVGADFEAAARLLDRADHSVLERVESPTMTAETLEVLASAIDRRRRHDSVLTTCVGEISDRDALAQAADRLLDLEGVTTTVVFGVIEDTVYVSARARGAAIDLGETLRTAYDRLGSAGGHAEMAGAQIPMGMLVEPGDDDPVTIVDEVLTRAFLDAVRTTYTPSAGQYATVEDELSFLTTASTSRGGAAAERGRGPIASALDRAERVDDAADAEESDDAAAEDSSEGAGDAPDGD